MKRLFIAVTLHPDKDFNDTLLDLQTNLKRERITWVSGHNLHLTLKFFGETNEKMIPAIEEAMHLATAGLRSFNVCFNRTGIFGSSYNPKVIWLGSDKNPVLIQLFSQLKTELKKAGKSNDRQNFVPHLTLGRIKEISDKSLFQQVIEDYRETFSMEESVISIQLYESILTPKGPVYITLNTAHLLQQ